MAAKQSRSRRKRKEHRIELLVSVEVAESWKRHALELGVSVGEFIRQSVGMDGKVRARVKTIMNPADREAYRERTLQIARIGNNLNQIARHVNTDKATDERMTSQLLQLRDSIERIE